MRNSCARGRRKLQFAALVNLRKKQRDGAAQSRKAAPAENGHCGVAAAIAADVARAGAVRDSRPLSANIDPAYAAAGFCVSLLVGMTGVGGGSLVTPLLILLFGVHPATAVGTDLLYAAATKSSGTLVHGLNRNIEWRVVGRLAAGSVPTTAITLVHRPPSASTAAQREI